MVASTCNHSILDEKAGREVHGQVRDPASKTRWREMRPQKLPSDPHRYIMGCTCLHIYMYTNTNTHTHHRIEERITKLCFCFEARKYFLDNCLNNCQLSSCQKWGRGPFGCMVLRMTLLVAVGLRSEPAVCWDSHGSACLAGFPG